jgi:hypothetical protein
MIEVAGPAEAVEGLGLSVDSHFDSFHRSRPVHEDRPATIHQRGVSQKNRLWRFWPFQGADSMSSVLKRLCGAGLVLGVIGGAVLGGFLAQRLGHGLSADNAPFDNVTAGSDAIRDGFFKANSLHATASYGHESLVMATGEVDNGIEAVYMLDGLTGELNGGVINNNSRKFTIRYVYNNVVKDLGADTVKNPKFLMVTGELPLTQGRGTRMGRCVLYIAELNSGYVVAYGAPWDATRYASMQVTTVPLVPLDRFKYREAIIRPQ